MSLTDLLPDVTALSRLEKLRLIELVAAQLVAEESEVVDDFDAEATLSKVLEEIENEPAAPSTWQKMDDPQKIRMLPEPLDVPGVETGAVQFSDDHPGLFVRGDNAVALMIWIQDLGRRLAGHPDEMVHDRMDRINGFAKIIEEDVKYRTT